MRRPRSWIDAPLTTGRRVILPAENQRHLLQVLRLGAGDEVWLFNGRDGRDHRARLIPLGRKCWAAELLSSTDPEPLPVLALHLALGISRAERMDWALQKAVELGAVSFQPLFTRRTQVKLAGPRLEKRMQRWQGVITSACEQSGRRRLPALHPPRSLEQWLAGHRPPTVLLDPRAEIALPQMPPPQDALCFLVGPEGGLSPEERDRAQESGCTGVRLGPRILRAETAPLAALAAAQTLWGDFR